MGYKHKISYNIDGNSDLQLFHNHLIQLNPPAVVIIGGFHNVELLRQKAPDILPIYRGIVDKDGFLHQDMSPQEFVDRSLHAHNNGGIIYTTNEPATNRDSLRQLVDWHIEVLDFGVQHGMKFCIANFGAGGPDLADYDVLIPLLRKTEQYYDSVIWGFHEYAAAIITWGIEVDGSPVDSPDVDNWPHQIRHTNHWLVGRYKQFFRFCDRHGIRRPRIVITEYGFDDLTDSRSAAWLDTIQTIEPYDHARSWHSLVFQWSKWWPQWSAEKAYMQQLIWANQNIYTEPEVLACCLFAVNDHPRWEDFNLNHATKFQELNYLYKLNLAVDRLQDDLGIHKSIRNSINNSMNSVNSSINLLNILENSIHDYVNS